MDDSELFVYFTDPNGDTIRYLSHNGTPLITVPGMRERLARVGNIEARHDDVLICGYSKSGTHWMWDVVKMVLDGSVEPINFLKNKYMLEFQTLDYLESLPSPRVLNNHFLLDEIPPDFLNRKCKMVYLLRNPKDVACSHFHHARNIQICYQYSGQWSGFLELWLRGDVDNGSWFRYVTNWERGIRARPDLPIHVVHYEHLIKDFVGEAKRISAFLGVERNDEFFAQLAGVTSFDTMKTQKDRLYTEEDRACWRDGQPRMYRKGKVGDWKNHFTVAQNEHFDAILKKELKHSQLAFCYEL